MLAAMPLLKSVPSSRQLPAPVTPLRGRLLAGAVAAGLGLGLVACAPGQEPAPPETSPAGTETPGPSADPSGAPDDGEPAADLPALVDRVTLTETGEILGDLIGFTGVTALGDGQLLLAARATGQLVWVTADGTRREVTGVGAQQIQDEIAGAEDLIAAVDLVSDVPPVPGLFGVVPGSTDDSRIYFFVSTGLTSRVVSATWADGTLSELTEVIGGLPAGSGRNGGALALGPDGYLFVSVGDAGLPEQVQAPTALAGKILRIATDGTFPPNNPLTKSPVWSLGHGNVTGLVVTEQGAVYGIEQGSAVADELNLIIPGHNYGWPVLEGMGTEDQVRAGFTSPQLVWDWTRDPQTGDMVTAGDPVAIASAPEGLYVAGANGQHLWWMSWREQGIGVARPELTEPLGAIVGVATLPGTELAVLTGNTSPSAGTPTVPRTVFPAPVAPPVSPDTEGTPPQTDPGTEPDPTPEPVPTPPDRLLRFTANF